MDIPPVPVSATRLVTCLHRHRMPLIGDDGGLSFRKSFKSCGMIHKETKALLEILDQSREELRTALDGDDPDAAISVLRKYIPSLERLLLSCSVQQETAVLDVPLEFSWTSAYRTDDKRGRDAATYKGEALMYEMTMAFCALAGAHAVRGCGKSREGEFAHACASFKEGAGVLDYLHREHLPKWKSMNPEGSSNSAAWPIECYPGVCASMRKMFLCHSQMMAIGKSLQSNSKRNYGLLHKLTNGVRLALQKIVKMLRTDAPMQYCKLPVDILKYLSTMECVQESICCYFKSHKLWSDENYPSGYTATKKAREALEVRKSSTSKGIPGDINDKSSALYALLDDVTDLRGHLDGVARGRKRDVDTVYFCGYDERWSIDDSEVADIMNCTAYRGQGGDHLPGPVLLAVAGEEGGDNGEINEYEGMDDEEIAKDLQDKINRGQL